MHILSSHEYNSCKIKTTSILHLFFLIFIGGGVCVWSFQLIGSLSNRCLGPHSTNQWRYSFLFKETMDCADGFRTNALTSDPGIPSLMRLPLPHATAINKFGYWPTIPTFLSMISLLLKRVSCLIQHIIYVNIDPIYGSHLCPKSANMRNGTMLNFPHSS